MTQILLVLGFHRSGTSMAAMLLHRAGLFLGDRLLGADSTNPYGHFEDVEVLKIHDGILSDNQLSWRVGVPFVPVVTEKRWMQIRNFAIRRETHHASWGFKDPRACLFTMVWKYILPTLKTVIVYRDPIECHQSLTRRHSAQYFGKEGPPRAHLPFWQETDLALRMWLIHNKGLLQFANAHPGDSLVVSKRSLERGFPLTREVNRRWGFKLNSVHISEVHDIRATTQSRGKQGVSERRLVDEMQNVWHSLEVLDRQSWAEAYGEW